MNAAPGVVLLVRARHVQRSLEHASAPFALRDQVLPGQPSLFSEHLATVLPGAELLTGPAWELRFVPTDARDALRTAIAVQLAAGTAPRASGATASAFQAIVLVCATDEPAHQDVWTAALTAPGAAGGQVLWTKAALDAVEETPAASLYDWELRGGRLGFHECIYDNRLSLLDPPFERMFAAEVEQWVGPRRAGQAERAYGRAALASPTRPAVTNDLYGIALSGGGMRSATFSLGVLQALSQHDLLEPADYLSTVSGGGYVGISFSGLCAEELPYAGLERLGSDERRFPFALARSGLGARDGDATATSPVHGNETPALWHVRKYANLIAGGFGLLSLATWQLVGRYFVSTVALWLLFLVPLVGLAVVLVAGAWHWSWEVLADTVTQADRAWLAPILALSPLFVVLWVVLLRLVALVLPPAGDMRRPLTLWLGALGATLAAIAVVYASALAMQSFVDNSTASLAAEGDGEEWLRSLQLAIAPALVMGAFIALGFSTMAWDRGPLLGALAFLAVPFAGTLAVYLGGGPPELLWASFGSGLVAGGLVVATWARDAGRVWGVRILNGIASGAGAVLIAMLVGAGVWLFEAGRPILGQDGEAMRDVFRGWLAAGSAVASVMVGLGLPRMASSDRKGKVSRLLFGLGGYFILFSLAVFGAWAAWTVIDRNGSWLALPLAGIFAAILVFPLTLRLQRGVLLNVLSLSGVYEDRLQQTWIIGARPPRTERAETVPRWHRVWTRPDLTVTALAGAAPPATPYPLICATLNIPGSRGDKLPERKSDSFVIAPVYSGSALSRWAPTSTMDGMADMSLARAASISGAAVAPNMGEKTSGTLSILTTIFNVRTGRWVPNPRNPASRGLISRSLNAIPAVLYLRELLGNASRDDDFMYLSDGGHFENLGVYELFRRRCRYIVAVSSDIESIEGTDALGNLGTALRMARVDFGVEVSIPSLKPLLRNHETGRVLSYFAVGELRYGVAGDGQEPPPTGTFVLIKTGLVEDALTADLIQYLAGNPSFPYDSTLDQQFDQPQFESYRHLGYLAGNAMSLKASTWPEQAGPPPSGWPQPLAERFRALREDFDAVPSGLTDGRSAESDGDAFSAPPLTTA